MLNSQHTRAAAILIILLCAGCSKGERETPQRRADSGLEREQRAVRDDKQQIASDEPSPPQDPGDHNRLAPQPAAAEDLAAQAISEPTQAGHAGDKHMQRPALDLDQIKTKYHGKIKTGINGNNYERNVGNMLELLREWNPVGRTADEVRLILGDPSSTDEQGTLIYRFDSGYVGVAWGFRIKNGRVATIDEPRRVL